MEPFGTSEVANYPDEVDLLIAGTFNNVRTQCEWVNEKLTFERRVGFELLKLFIRYQIDLRIEANGVTPIPAPTSKTVSNY